MDDKQYLNPIEQNRQADYPQQPVNQNYVNYPLEPAANPEGQPPYYPQDPSAVGVPQQPFNVTENAQQYYHPQGVYFPGQDVESYNQQIYNQQQQFYGEYGQNYGQAEGYSSNNNNYLEQQNGYPPTEYPEQEPVNYIDRQFEASPQDMYGSGEYSEQVGINPTHTPYAQVPEYQQDYMDGLSQTKAKNKSKKTLWLVLSLLILLLIVASIVFLLFFKSPKAKSKKLTLITKPTTVANEIDATDKSAATTAKTQAAKSTEQVKERQDGKAKDAEKQKNEKEANKREKKDQDKQDQTVQKSGTEDLIKKFSTSFDNLISKYYSSGDSYSYALLDVESGSKVSNNGDVQVRAASSIKPFIMANIYQLVEDGTLDLNAQYPIRPDQKVGGSGVIINMNVSQMSLYDLVYYMMVESDNTAGNVLIDLAGGGSAVTAYCHSLGCNNTQCGRYFMQQAAAPSVENYTTANDLIELMRKLHAGELVSKERSKQMVDIMRQDEAENLFSEKIPASRIQDSYSKGGELDGNRSCVNVIKTDLGTYIVAGMVDYQNVESIKEDMRNIGKSVFEIYENTVK